MVVPYSAFYSVYIHLLTDLFADFNEDYLIDAVDMNKLLDLLTGGRMEESLKEYMIQQVRTL